MVEVPELGHGIGDTKLHLPGPLEVASHPGHVEVHWAAVRGPQMLDVAVNQGLRAVQVLVQALQDHRVLLLKVLLDEGPLQKVSHHTNQLFRQEDTDQVRYIG